MFVFSVETIEYMQKIFHTYIETSGYITQSIQGRWRMLPLQSNKNLSIEPLPNDIQMKIRKTSCGTFICTVVVLESMCIHNLYLRSPRVMSFSRLIFT